VTEEAGVSAEFTGRGGLIEQLQGEAMAALKAGDRRRAEALRLIVAALKQERTQGARHDLSEEEETAVLKRERKRRIEAAEVFEQAGRTEQAEQERYEQAVITSYLPEELPDDQLARLVDEVIASTGASSPKELGKVMGAVMKEVAGRAEGGRVNALVRARLGA
jgi:uncharacterized protein YqeY